MIIAESRSHHPPEPSMILDARPAIAANDRMASVSQILRLILSFNILFPLECIKDKIRRGLHPGESEQLLAKILQRSADIACRPGQLVRIP